MASLTAPQLGGMAWNLAMAVGGFGLLITGPKYLHLIDKGFRQKSASNPEAAAKQVKTFRLLGAVLGFCGLALFLLELFAPSR
jgi:hypothetical protein